MKISNKCFNYQHKNAQNCVEFCYVGNAINDSEVEEGVFSVVKQLPNLVGLMKTLFHFHLKVN